MKVGLFINRVADYTLPVFERLSELVDLHVYTFQGETPNTIKGKEFFSYPSGGYWLSDAPRAVGESHDVLVFAGLNYFTTHAGIVLSELKDTPMVVWVDEWAATQTSNRHKLLRPVKKALVSLTDGFIACGEPQARFLQSLGADPGAISIARYSACTIPDRETWSRPSGLDNIEPNHRVLLYFGRLLKRKGVLQVIDAFSMLDESIKDGCTLIVAGNGPLAEDVHDKCRGVDNAFPITKYVTHSEKGWLLANASVTCLPAEAEPWGIVVPESLSVGTPVIASTEVASALDHIKEGKNGALVPPLDEVAIVDTIENSLNFDHPLSPESDEKLHSAAKQAEQIFARIEVVSS